MRLLQIGLAIIAATAVSAGCDGSGVSGDDGQRLTETFRWSGPVAPGHHVEVKAIGGDVTFSPSTTSDLEVDAVKSGRRHHPSTVTIEVVEHAQGVRICTLYPDVPGQAPNSCMPGGNLSSRNNDVTVDFSVRAPPGRTLEAHVLGGNLTALGMVNEVILSTLNGNVVISTTDIGEGTTFDGDVTVTLGSTNPNRGLRFTTLSGNVIVTVPATINAEADLSTMNGTVASDFPLTQVGPGRLTGTLGSGGAALTLSSASGNVRLLRAP